MDFQKLMSKFKSDEKGVYGLDSVTAFFGAILGLAILAFVIIIIMGALQNTNILAANSVAANQTNNLLGNVSAGVAGFFTSINPVYAILAVLVIILVLVVLIKVVQPGQNSTGLAL